MVKSKNSPALFELIDKGDRRHRQNPLAVPKWFGRKPATELSAVTPIETEGVPATITPGSERLTLIPAVEEEHAFCAIHLGDRGVALNYVSTIIAGCLVVLLLIGTFALGRITASGDGAGATANATGVDDVTKALQGTPNPDTLKVGKQNSGASRSGANKDTGVSAPSKSSDGEKQIADAPTAAREAGVNYVVIETFKPEHRKSGEAIRDWLKSEYSLDTTLERIGERLGLVTTLGFDYKEPGQKERCEEFLNKVKSLSEEGAKELSSKGLPVYRLFSPYPKQFPK